MSNIPSVRLKTPKRTLSNIWFRKMRASLSPVCSDLIHQLRNTHNLTISFLTLKTTKNTILVIFFMAVTVLKSCHSNVFIKHYYICRLKIGTRDRNLNYYGISWQRIYFNLLKRLIYKLDHVPQCLLYL